MREEEKSKATMKRSRRRRKL